MKLSICKKGMALLLGLMMVLVLVTPALAASKSRVFVEYKSGQKAAVKSALVKAKADFHYTFDELNSFVVSVPATAVKGLMKNPRIASIEVDPVRELVPAVRSELAPAEIGDPFTEQVVPYGVNMVQAPQVWDLDVPLATGEGITVCIIDTGYYSGHEDLKDAIGGMSQVDDNYLRDGYGHGTHVAGTIAANDNDFGVVGVTPGTVDLYIVKIFADDGSWVKKAHASDLIKAAYACQSGGADIISMSLSGTKASTKEEKAFNSLYDAGILSVAAASNDGVSDYHYPASYDSVISVGALDSTMTWATFSNYNDQVELAAPGVGVLSTIPYIDISNVTVDSVSYIAAPVTYAPLGTKEGVLTDGGLCTTTGDWAGKVVLCKRGDISFYDKVMNVENSDGIAAVIYNNIMDEMLYATLGDGNSSEIVAVSITMNDGLSLMEKLGFTATVNALIVPGSNYEAWDGTSMATPHVSGVAALIWSAHPDWTNVQVREAMAATALDLGDPGRDVYYGFGLVQAKAALDYLYENYTP